MIVRKEGHDIQQEPVGMFAFSLMDISRAACREWDATVSLAHGMRQNRALIDHS
jgi:hypothetical protein